MPTPKQIVTEMYPQAKALLRDDGRYTIYNYGQNGPSILGHGKPASAAWKDAADFCSIVAAGSKEEENYLHAMKTKISRRRRRIGEKIQAGTYARKTADTSANIGNRERQREFMF